MTPGHLFVALFGAWLWAAQQPATAPNPSPAPAPAAATANQIVIPADTTIPLELRVTINSRTAYVGQMIYCETVFPITVGNRIVIPVGSYVKGHVTEVKRPGHVKGKAQLGLVFDTLTLPNGTSRPLRAVLSGFGGTGNEGFKRDESKVQGASSKGEDAGKVAQTTITGAEIGTIAGAAGHNVGKGLGIGSAAGAAGGLIWVLASRGKEVVLPSGTNLELQLLSPMQFYSDEVAPPSPYRNGPALPPHEVGPGK